MRLHSTADNRISLARERFASPVNVIGIFCAFMLVLALLYPEQGLLGLLSGGDDPATMRYREALLRIRPQDNDLRFKVAEALVRNGHPARALEVLSGFPAGLTERRRQAVLELRYKALRDLFVASVAQSSEWSRLKPMVAAAARETLGSNPPVWRLRVVAEDFRKAGDQDAWLAYDRQAAAKEALEGRTETTGFDYRAEATACFREMGQAGSLAQRRELFIKGVRALQAGNLPKEAFEAGERNIGGLYNDRRTLIFLTRVGLAAGQPARAQRLIKRALGIQTTSGAAP
ncbi:MAG TPA: hypothetical protein PLN25_11080 [Deltaproteobacteria bacterium]|nr:hypothetical protein [Deltaproteobacteria bacterium]HQB39148.1 hypothetical protein [Deltaproteobacteria bacterium]